MERQYIIYFQLSAHPAVVRYTVIVRPLVSASATMGGRALAVMSVYPIQGACMAPANYPGSADVTRDGMACCVTRVKMSEIRNSVFSLLCFRL